MAAVTGSTDDYAQLTLIPSEQVGGAPKPVSDKHFKVSLYRGRRLQRPDMGRSTACGEVRPHRNYGVDEDEEKTLEFVTCTDNA